MGACPVLMHESALNADLLVKSIQVLAPRGEVLVNRFYEELFRRHPDLRPLFANVDMTRQKGHFLSALVLVTANLDNPQRLKAALAPMGARHQSYGVRPEHYGAVASTLLAVMAGTAGDLWSDHIESAWSNALEFVVSEMLSGYRA